MHSVIALPAYSWLPAHLHCGFRAAKMPLSCHGVSLHTEKLKEKGAESFPPPDTWNESPPTTPQLMAPPDGESVFAAAQSMICTMSK